MQHGYKRILVLIFFCLSIAIYGQVDVSATGGTPTASYTTLKGAFDAINAGTHTGVITIGISGSTTESASAVLSATTYTSISIYPTATGKTISGAIAGALIQFNGAKNVTLDGSLNHAGAGRDLTIDNTSTSGYALQFINDGSSNTVKYCFIKGSNSSISGGIIYFATSTGSNGNNSNTIDNCNIFPSSGGSPLNSIFALGTSGKDNKFNTISNCNIYDFRGSGTSSHYGIFISSYNSDWTVDGNSIYQSTAYAGPGNATCFGIGISTSTGVNFVVRNNNIGGSSANCGGTWTINGTVQAYKFVGINITAGTTSASTVQNNTIKGFTWLTTSSSSTVPGNWCGIRIQGGNVNVGASGYPNTIGDDNTGSISITESSNTGGACFGIANDGSGTVNIAYNKIGSITTTGSSTISCGVVGIQATAGTNSITNNLVGSLTTANSINASSSSTSTTAQISYGIVFNCGSANSNTQTISNNTVANLTNNYAYTTTATSIRGISFAPTTATNFTGTAIINGNTIYTITGSQPAAGSGSTSNMVGIQAAISSAASITMTGNTIYNLRHTGAAAVTVNGIYYSGPSTGTNKIDKNLVRDIYTTSNTSIQNGINIALGLVNVQNNVIRLGRDKDGNSITATVQINGIYKSGGTNNYYFNTVYIGGNNVTGSGVSTYCFNMNSHTGEDIRNNIFMNNRTAATPALAHYAIWYNSASLNSNFTSDYNIYYVSATDGKLGRISSTDKLTLQLIREALPGFEYHSGVGDPKLSSPDAAYAAGNLSITNTSPAEGTGVVIAGIDDDYTGTTVRSTSTPTDIGAYAGNFTAPGAGQDIFSPVISYTTLSNTSSTSTRTTVSFATVSDQVSGVNTTSGTMPRLYYKKSTDANAFVGNTSADNGWKWVEANNTTSPFDFTIDYSIINGGSGTVVAGVIIQYYVVAQDQATTPNVFFLPLAGSAGTSVGTTGMTAPTTPNSYTVVQGFTGTVTVGSGQYTSLTANTANGLFKAINSGTLTGNVTVSIVGDLTEDGSVALNQWSEEGAGNYTLTITTDGSARTVAGSTSSSSVPLLDFNGADRVTIDGTAGKLLTIRSANATPSSTGPVIRFYNSSVNCVLTNSIIESNATSTTLGSVTIGSGTNSVSITANDIRDSRGSVTGNPNNGIYSNTSTNTLTITNNNIYNWKNSSGNSYGLYLLSLADGATVNGNSFYMEAAAAPVNSQTAIYIGTGNNHSINGNYIGGQSANCGGSQWTNSGTGAIIGISVSTSTTTATNILNNRIQNFNLSGSGAASFTGISVSGGKVTIGTSGNGNKIGDDANPSLGITYAGTSSVVGITSSSSSVTGIDYNTIGNISVTGTGTGASIKGISYSSGLPTVTNNIITALSTAATNTGSTSSSAIIGISTTSGGLGQVIASNRIYGFDATTTAASAVRIVGIYAGGASSTGSVSKNKIYDLKNACTGNGYITGYLIYSGGAWTFDNNMISISNGSYTNAVTIQGIWENSGTTGTKNYYYNSVYIGGSAVSGTLYSYAFNRAATTSIQINNNLFYNGRTGGATANHFAISNSTTTSNWTTTSSNYNVLISPDTNKVGEWGSGVAVSFAGWKAAQTGGSGGDANSWSGTTAYIPAGNLFTNTATGTLTINTANKEAWLVNGKGIAVTGEADDFSSAAVRSVTAGLPTDIGANEITVSASPAAATAGATIADGVPVVYTYAGRPVATITWNNGTGAVPTAATLTYYSGTTPSGATGTYARALWKLNATGGTTGWNCTVKLNYDVAQLGNVTENNLVMVQEGLKLGSSSLDNTNKTVTNSNVSFAPGFDIEFALGDNSQVFPVELSSFDAIAEGRNCILKWKTQSEINSAYFEVQRASAQAEAEAQNWESHGKITAAGFSNTVNSYQFTDTKLNTGSWLYRLKMVDNDGSFSYSKISRVTVSAPDNFELSQNYPNPFNPSTKIDYSVPFDAHVTVDVYAITGEKLMQLVNANYTAGYYTSMLSAANAGLSSGAYIYVMRAKAADGRSFVSSKKMMLIK